jgi:uncharacterized protein YecE (DUF72 family)
MSQILVGTASWTDKSLIQSARFYPPQVETPEDRLRYYATQFPVVEVDSSYYAMPSAHNAQLWAERTPDAFVFDVKAFRLFTQHQTPPQALPKDIQQALNTVSKKNIYYRDMPKELLGEMWQRFETAIQPLEQKGKLGAVLFQFPPWFVCSRASFGHMEDCIGRLNGYRLAVEFRNRTWFDDRHREQTLEFARTNGIAHVVVDEPQGFASSIPPVWEATCPELAVVRLHGRNHATWEIKGLSSSAERFNYLYSDAELNDLASPIDKLSRAARRVHVLFNNNYEDYGQRNALQLTKILNHGD